MSGLTQAGCGRAALLIAVTVLIALVIGANVHFVYIAFASQPDCVPHRRVGEPERRGTFAAANSSCTPSVLAVYPRSEK